MSLESINRKAKARIVKLDDKLGLEINRAWNRTVGRNLDRHYLDLAKELQNARQAGAFFNFEKSASYKALNKALAGELAAFTKAALPLITAQQARYVRLGLVDSLAMLNTGPVKSRNGLPGLAFTNRIGKDSKGDPLINLLTASWGDSLSGITGKLVYGTLHELPPTAVAASMKQGAARSLNRVLTTGRQETFNLYREATIAQFKNSGRVKQYRRVAVLDRRTCVVCVLLHGKIYSINEGISSHIRCRCTLVPIIAGLNDDGGIIDGEDWLAHAPADVQAEVMGVGAARLYQAGKIKMGDMITASKVAQGGTNLNPTPLYALPVKGGAAARIAAGVTTPGPQTGRQAVSPAPGRGGGGGSIGLGIAEEEALQAVGGSTGRKGLLAALLALIALALALANRDEKARPEYDRALLTDPYSGDPFS